MVSMWFVTSRPAFLTYRTFHALFQNISWIQYNGVKILTLCMCALQMPILLQLSIIQHIVFFEAIRGGIMRYQLWNQIISRAHFHDTAYIEERHPFRRRQEASIEGVGRRRIECSLRTLRKGPSIWLQRWTVLSAVV